MEKILTIVIPTYNMENFLPKALTSLVVEEELMNILEVIVVNDGSKDSSLDIAYAFQKQYPQTFHVINKENGNYGSCVNRGLLEAKGKYIKILDADDSFDNAAFLKYLQIISGLNVDLIINDVLLVDTNGCFLEKWKLSLPQFQFFDFFSYECFPEMHMVAYQTEKLRRMGYKQTEGISYTDQEWVFHPLSTVTKSYYCPITLYMYLVGREGQTMNPMIQRKYLSNKLIVFKNMLKIYSKENYVENVNRWMMNKLLCNLHSLFKTNIIDLGDDKNQDIIDCDLFIKENYPKFYGESEKCLIVSKRFKYNYGHYWRKHYKLNYYNPLLWVYYAVKKIKKKNILE